MTTALRSYEKALEITEHNEWSQTFWNDLLPFKDRISQHPFFCCYGRWNADS